MRFTCKLAVCILCMCATSRSQEITIGVLKIEVEKSMEAHNFRHSKAAVNQPKGGVLDQWYLAPGLLFVTFSADTQKVINMIYSNEYGGRKGLRHDSIDFSVDSFNPEKREIIVRLNTKVSEQNDKPLKSISVNQSSELLRDQMQISGFGKGVNLDDTKLFSYSIWNVNHGILMTKFRVKTKEIVSMSYVQIVSGDDGFSSSAINVKSINFPSSTMTLVFKK